MMKKKMEIRIQDALIINRRICKKKSTKDLITEFKLGK